MFKTISFHSLVKLCSTALTATLLAFNANSQDNGPGCASILATIGGVSITTNGPSSGTYTGSMMEPIVTLSGTSAFIPQSGVGPQFGVLVDGVLDFGMMPIGNGFFGISQSSIYVGTKNYAVVLYEPEPMMPMSSCYVTATGININIVSGLPTFTCTSAPTIGSFGFFNQTTSSYNSTHVIEQCSGNGGFSYNVTLEGFGPGPLPNDVYYEFYSNGGLIGSAPSFMNFFYGPNTLPGIFNYTMKAINNCGTTTSDIITLTITSNPNNCGGGGGGNCGKTTITGQNITTINTTLFGTALYSVTAVAPAGASVTGYTWYKALPGVTPPLTNSSQVGIVFGNTNTLRIMYATDDDAGYYAVVANSSCGDGEPHFFDIIVNTTSVPGFVYVLPAVETVDLGGDFAIPFTTPGFVIPTDTEGNFDLEWEDVVGINLGAGDTYCVKISLSPDFTKSKEICGLTTSGLTLTPDELNAYLLSDLQRTETGGTQNYYYKVAPVVSGNKASFSAPAAKAFTNSSLVISGLDKSSSEAQLVSVYPNPNSGNFTLVAKGEVVIYNTVGTVVKSFTSSGKTEVTGLSKGFYIVSVGSAKIKLIVE